jgi:SAM-dependent methyltransferase
VKPDYGNWVSKDLVLIPLVLGLILAAIAALLPIIVVVAGVLFAVSGYFAYARFVFGKGGDAQTKIRNLVLSNLEWEGGGKALDVGCGNGALANTLAKKFPMIQVVGVDSWGRDWEYSKGACERNAGIEGVGSRVTFQKASAISLPFPDGSFDIVVSNLTFHEVKDAPDKRELLKEALRVLREGGKFVLQDLFLFKAVYGDIDDLTRWVQELGLKSVEFVPTRDSPFIPRLLKLPFMVGSLGIIKGVK